MKSSPASSALITSPLLLRSSLWVSLRVIQLSVARVRRWNFAFQKGFTEVRWQAARRVGRQDAEQRAPGRHPGKRLLQYPDKQIALMELPYHEGRERPLGLEIRAKQDAAGLDARDPQSILEKTGRQVQSGDRLTRQRQHRGQALEPFGIAWHDEVARRSPRGRPQLGQVRRQPLLQLARPAGSHKGRPWRPTADVDEEAGTIGLRVGTGKRRGRRPRSTYRTNRGDKDDPTVHRPTGLA